MGEDGRDAAALQLPMPVLDEATATDLLARGELAIVGRLLASSNNALLCTATLRTSGSGQPAEHEAHGATGLVATCVYKPTLGERPLDDFPDGTLARREVAAYAVSRAGRWGIVPPTILRDGPFGEGMLQLWIDMDPEADPIALVLESDPRLRRIAAFDAVVNNTDRKAGHLLPVVSGRVYGVDHGVCFSPVPKLRTVLWNWRGDPFEDAEAEAMRATRDALDGALGDELRELLDPIEVAATARRIDRLLAAGAFPHPDPRRPALPWPPV